MLFVILILLSFESGLFIKVHHYYKIELRLAFTSDTNRLGVTRVKETLNKSDERQAIDVKDKLIEETREDIGKK